MKDDYLCVCGHLYSDHQVCMTVTGEHRVCMVKDSVGIYIDRCYDFRLDNLKYLEIKYEQKSR